MPEHSANPIQRYSLEHGYLGLDVPTSANLLRRYVTIERALLRMLAGWFIAAPAYETKYALAYHVLDHAEHVNWMRQRLSEMRGGHIEASVEPALLHCLEESLHAGTIDDFLTGAYLELKGALLASCEDHLAAADRAANAAEIRILQRIIPDLRRHVEWARSVLEESEVEQNAHRQLVGALLHAAGGVSGLAQRPIPEAPAPRQSSVLRSSPNRFHRPATIVFDSRIGRGDLMAYDQRKSADATESAVEDFKVFFNEMYAASLLASILFDADPREMPWEFFYDVAHHFWDEARHSEFGMIRLTELGHPPSVCNPILFERSQNMPILHRFCYLTLGLETHFMPRKRPRVTKYTELGDRRSQLFADQDWSDEVMHVKYGKKWLAHFLQDDFRSEEDVLEEVRQQIAAVTGEKEEKIVAPF